MTEDRDSSIFNEGLLTSSDGVDVNSFFSSAALTSAVVATSGALSAAASCASLPSHVNSSDAFPPAGVTGEAGGGGEAIAARGGVEGGGHTVGGEGVRGLPTAIKDFSEEEVGLWLVHMKLGEFIVSNLSRSCVSTI